MSRRSGPSRSRSAGQETRPKVAIVHDYLSQRGGAERVVLSMLKAFPEAPLYTAVYDREATYPEFAAHDVRPLWTNRLGLLRRDYRRGLLLYPLAFSSLKVDADIVLCSSSGYAHAVRATGRKVVYCYTPARWLYDQADTYLTNWPAYVNVAVCASGPALRRWDRRAAKTADVYLTSSSAVRDRIKTTYGIAARVVPPAVPNRSRTRAIPVSDVRPGFVLCVSRLLGYKNVDAVCAAFKELPDARLVVVGDGPEYRRLAVEVPANVLLAGRVSDGQLTWLYENSAGVVSASYEDFGLTVIEAGSYGKPVAVFRWGGFLDTVVEGITGVFFDQPTPTAVVAAVSRMMETDWDSTAIEEWAEHFSEESFIRRLKETVQVVG